MMKFLPLFLTLSCLGHSPTLVAPPEPISWAFGCDVSQADRQVIREGFELWNGGFERDVLVEFPCVPRGNVIYTRWLVVTSDETRRQWDGMRWHKTFAIAYYSAPPDYSSSTVVFYREWRPLGETAKTNVAIHEAGHVLGYRHTEYTSCVMFKWIDPVVDNRRLKPLC